MSPTTLLSSLAVGDTDRIRLHVVEFESPESSGKPGLMTCIAEPGYLAHGNVWQMMACSWMLLEASSAESALL